MQMIKVWTRQKNGIMNCNNEQATCFRGDDNGKRVTGRHRGEENLFYFREKTQYITNFMQYNAKLPYMNFTRF